MSSVSLNLTISTMANISKQEFFLKGYYMLQQVTVRLDQINKYAQSIRDTVTPEESYQVLSRINVLLRNLTETEPTETEPTGTDLKPNHIK